MNEAEIKSRSEQILRGLIGFFKFTDEDNEFSNAFVLIDCEGPKAYLSFIINKEAKLVMINHVRSYEKSKEYGRQLILNAINYFKNFENNSLKKILIMADPSDSSEEKDKKFLLKYYSELGFKFKYDSGVMEIN